MSPPLSTVCAGFESATTPLSVLTEAVALLAFEDASELLTALELDASELLGASELTDSLELLGELLEIELAEIELFSEELTLEISSKDTSSLADEEA